MGDFMPLTVDYKEYTYAGGRIPGGFFKREGRRPRRKFSPAASSTVRSVLPSRRATARRRRSSRSCCRPTARTIPTSSRSTRASAALVISEIPFHNPIAAVRVGSSTARSSSTRPTRSATSDLDLIVAGTNDAIVMVEAGAREVERERRARRLRRRARRDPPHLRAAAAARARKPASRSSPSPTRRSSPTSCCTS